MKNRSNYLSSLSVAIYLQGVEKEPERCDRMRAPEPHIIIALPYTIEKVKKYFVSFSGLLGWNFELIRYPLVFTAANRRC